jgi:hypothetical protein
MANLSLVATFPQGWLVDERLTEQPVETFCGQWL